MSESLSEREHDILKLMADGLTNQEIASQLYIAFETVRWYAKGIYSKLGVRNRTHAVTHARKLGLLNFVSDSTTSLLNLPAELTPFVGRETEITVVQQLLSHARLLTLTGAGGSGKTRMSVTVARGLSDEFADSIYFVDFAPVKDSVLVAKTIAETLGIGEFAHEDQLETIKRVMKHWKTLLILDNFEHLMEATPVVSQLLQATSELKLIVTSRERLNLVGEQEYIVPPLTLPEQAATYEQQSTSESVTLFVQRAQMVRSGFTLDRQNIHDIVEICHRLDGLPLAIELAAARCKIFSPQTILARLDNRLDLLVEGQRDLPARHQTLRNTIDWSYNLLNATDKILLRRLAVFAGGASLETIEGVCNIGESINILEGLTSLANKSLLNPVHQENDDVRFVLLDTIHEYAHEKLEASDEHITVNQQHTQYFLQLAQQSKQELRLSNQQYWFKRLTKEHENFRIAIHRCMTRQEEELALQLVIALRDYWFYQGYHSEGIMWLEDLSTTMSQSSPIIQADAKIVRGLLAYAKQEPARSYLEDAVQILRQLDDIQNTAWALSFLAFVSEAQPDIYADAITACEQSLVIFQQVDHLPGIAWALNVLGNLSRMNGDYFQAKILYEECLDVCRLTGEKRRIAMVLGNLGIIAERKGQYQEAKKWIHSSIELARDIEFEYTIPAKLSLMAGVLASLGESQRATMLLSASLAINERMGIVAQANTQIEIDRYISALHLQLESADFDEYWQEGRRMSLSNAIDLSLQI